MLLVDAFGRVAESIDALLDQMTDEKLATRRADQANPIAWSVWDLTRVRDDHVADVAGTPQVSTAQLDGASFADRFGLSFDDDATGCAASSADVGQPRVSADLLAGHHRAVHRRTMATWRA